MQMQQRCYMALIQGKVYVGRFSLDPVFYLGCWSYDGDGAPRLHQFEYLSSPDVRLAGYGQTTEQANSENYVEHRALTILYGRIID